MRLTGRENVWYWELADVKADMAQLADDLVDHRCEIHDTSWVDLVGCVSHCPHCLDEQAGRDVRIGKGQKNNGTTAREKAQGDKHDNEADTGWRNIAGSLLDTGAVSVRVGAASASGVTDVERGTSGAPKRARRSYCNRLGRKVAVRPVLASGA
jgi:hypothetical protein